MILAHELERVGMLVPELVRAAKEVSKELITAAAALKVEQTFCIEHGAMLDSLK